MEKNTLPRVFFYLERFINVANVDIYGRLVIF